MSNYQIDYCYDFPVVHPVSPDDDSFVLRVEGPDGPSTVKLTKLAFQRTPDYKAPALLHCRVKSIEDGFPVLTHVVAPYVHSLYADTFAKGETFVCEVMSVPESPAEEPFMIRDRYGIFYRLNEPDGLLTKGQKLRCRFTRLTPRFFNLIRADEGAKMPFYPPEFLLDAVSARGSVRAFVLNRLLPLPEMEVARREIHDKNPLWVMTAARVMLRRLPEWFLRASLRRQNNAYRVLLTLMKDVLLYLLEGSGFLNAVPAEQRRAYQQQLTDYADALSPFDTALKIIRDNEQDIFVERLFDKLQKSGYLYHPARQFAILMIIFRLHPDKVGYYLSRIFESIFGRDLENWKREPFRSAFVEQFEIYVSEARRDIDALPMAESREQKSRLETIITAIALQMLLADKNVDMSRSRSLFYRYIALLRPLNTEALLSKSFLELMGEHVSSPLSYEHLKEPMMMMTRATVMPSGDFMARIGSRHRYTGGQADVTISADGIVLSRPGRRDITGTAIPVGLMPWLKPQVLVDGVKTLNGTRLRKLADHNLWWHDIEESLFDSTPAASAPQRIEHPRRRAEIGDEVYVTIEGVDDFFNPNPTFRCAISDEDFLDGTGILKRDMVVGYNLKQPSPRAYRMPDGTSLEYLARVLDVRADGSYIFSLRDEVDAYLEEELNYDDEYLAVITGINGRDYSAIAKMGCGLFIERGDTELAVGDIVRCRLNQTGKQGMIRGYVVNVSTDRADKFDKSDAFYNLMQRIGLIPESHGQVPDEEGDEVFPDLDEILTSEQIRELIGIIRMRAIAETELIKAYDYLRFARLLAMAIGDNRLAGVLEAHASLLSLHQYYATNSRIDADKLEDIAATALADPLLRSIYHRLEIVSWLGRSDRNAELYASSTNPASELEGSIARMVLSYNLLHASEGSDDGIAGEIKQKIMERLNVNNETRRGKYYGSESKYLEFKTSIVYPAASPGEEMREDPAAQQFHILSRVAGLLNANGGRLYIGVNNDGYEVGMHDDFKYFERHKATAGKYQFRITNTDSLCVFLENLVNETFGANVGRKIAISADDEAEKEVILITIDESLEPVFLDGRLFVRQSGQSTREYHSAEIDDFVRERSNLLAERNHMMALAARTQAEAAPVPQPEATIPARPIEVPVSEPEADSTVTSADAVEATDESGKLITSRWKPNVLHNYEPGYVEPFGYIYFTSDGKLRYSTTDLYMDTDEENCPLALTIPHDVHDSGFLLLCYDNERTLRIPLAEIYEKGENVAVEYSSDGKLMFAVIASKDDALVCVGADSGGSLWKRATKVGHIDQAHLMSTPRRLHDAPINHTVTYELADASALDAFADCMADKLAGKRFGATMRVKENTAGTASKIADLAAKCHTLI